MYINASSNLVKLLFDDQMSYDRLYYRVSYSSVTSYGRGRGSPLIKRSDRGQDYRNQSKGDGITRIQGL